MSLTDRAKAALTRARMRRRERLRKQREELAAKHAPTSRGYLNLLQGRDNVYVGSASRNKVRKRRRKNKVAKQSRKRNRP
jgi:hypothetical protein